VNQDTAEQQAEDPPVDDETQDAVAEQSEDPQVDLDESTVAR
jgi:hypothetical protein